MKLSSTILPIKSIMLMAIFMGSTSINAQTTNTPQTLTIDSCYILARENYPTIKKFDLIDKSSAFALDNANKGNLPKISFGAEATYQSDVTTIPIDLPGNPIQPLNKDQYKVYADLEQNIYDGGRIKNNKAGVNATAKVKHQSLEVSLYQLRNRVNQVYFGILLIDANIQQNKIHQLDLKAGLKQTKAMVNYGTALKSNAAIIEAAILEVDQEQETLRSNRTAYLKMLGLLLHRNLNDSTKLLTPARPPLSTQNHRPELALFEARSDQLNIQKDDIRIRNKPKLNLFVRGGYGRPGLNMLSNQFDGYYLGGIRLSWPLFGLYTAKNEQQQITIQQKEIKLDKETFLFNTTLKSVEQLKEINNIQALITTDSSIVQLRQQVAKVSFAQFKNGVITVNDYVQNLLKEHLARQREIYHQLKLISTIYHQNNTFGE